MGCDIHILVEVKVDGHWVPNTKPVFVNPWYRENEKDKPKERRWRLAVEKMSVNVNDSRNYDWFAILANVRNGRGFAGVNTGEGFAVIAEPRGIPFDASEHWQQEVKEWGMDMHSHSCLYLEDFDKFDWNQVTMKYGVVTFEQYKVLRDTNEAPDGWCGAVSGSKVITISEDTANKVLEGKKEVLTKKDRRGIFDPPDKIEITDTRPIAAWDIYVNYSWSVLYSEWFKRERKDIEPLRALGELYEDVRIVFGFDN